MVLGALLSRLLEKVLMMIRKNSMIPQMSEIKIITDSLINLKVLNTNEQAVRLNLP
jgi:hypothetical protein